MVHEAFLGAEREMTLLRGQSHDCPSWVSKWKRKDAGKTWKRGKQRRRCGGKEKDRYGVSAKAHEKTYINRSQDGNPDRIMKES
jgi:hypothetical protein